MLISHTLAGTGVEVMMTVSPETPLISVGYFRDPEREGSEITSAVEAFHEESDAQTPGVEPKDVSKTVMEAK